MEVSSEQLLRSYVVQHYARITDISQFYATIDWQYLSTTLGVEVEIVKTRVDQIYDELVFSSIEHLVGTLRQRKDPIFQKVSQQIDVLKLKPFEIEATSVAAPLPEKEANGVSNRTPAPQMLNVPVLAQPRRLSLELMQRPAVHNRTSVAKPAELSTTNVNVITRAELPANKPQGSSSKALKFSLLKKKKPVSKEAPPPPTKDRRGSVVGERLPSYIREILDKERADKALEEESLERPKSPTRLQNVLSNSQSLYKNMQNTPELPDEDKDEEDDLYNEYISPNSLTRYLQVEDLETNDEILKELGSEEEDFANSLRDDDEDYLFKM